jgi:nucleotide-binding universal stress UspA family protein
MNILLPTDGSRHALEAARALADWIPATAHVDLLAVVPRAQLSPRRTFSPQRDLVGQWRAAAGHWLDETARPLAARGLEVKRLLRAGNAAQVVVERACAVPYDLIVVGAKGRGDAPFFDIGSVALAALEHAPGSILMVRGRGTGHGRASSPERPLRVLLPSNGRKESVQALRRALGLLPPGRARARVLVVADRAAGGELDPRAAWTAAHDAAAQLRAHEWDAEPTVAAGDPKDRILEAAGGADLVVLGSRSVVRIEERHLGSVALEVARAAPCSVLVVRGGVSGRARPRAAVTASAAGTPFEIAYRDVEPAVAVEERVLKGLARLEKIAPDVVRCRVTVGRRSHGNRKGDLYDVGVVLTVPGREVAITRTPPTHKAGETLGAAVADAFEKARKQLLESRREERHARRAPRRRAQARTGRPPRASSAA